MKKLFYKVLKTLFANKLLKPLEGYKTYIGFGVIVVIVVLEAFGVEIPNKKDILQIIEVAIGMSLADKVRRADEASDEFKKKLIDISA